MPNSIELLENTFSRIAKSIVALQQEQDADAAIEEDNLTTHLAEHTELYLKWARLTTYAELRCKEAEDLQDRIEAECKIAIRQEQEKAGNKVTETHLKDLALCHPDFIKIKEVYRDAYEVWQYMLKAERAMASRSRLLESINYRQSREYDGYDTESFVHNARGKPFKTLAQLRELEDQQNLIGKNT